MTSAGWRGRWAGDVRMRSAADEQRQPGGAWQVTADFFKVLLQVAGDRFAGAQGRQHIDEPDPANGWLNPNGV